MKETIKKIEKKVVVVKDDIKGKIISVKDWALDNPEDAAILAGTIVVGIKVLKKNKASADRDKCVWCPQYGCYIPTRRKLTYNEKIEFGDRCRDGEDPRDVLRMMRLFK